MAELLERVGELPNICEIELAFTGTMLPAAIEGYQQFYNSLPEGTDFTTAHFGRATVNFSEESMLGRPGTAFRQKLSITFPVSDSQRAQRLALMNKVKYIKILLSNDKHLVMGRNDFEQNARIKVKTKTDERLGQVEFESLSVGPCGYTPVFEGGLPVFFPINFIED